MQAIINISSSNAFVLVSSWYMIRSLNQERQMEVKLVFCGVEQWK